MKTSYRIGDIQTIRSEMISNVIVTSRPERAIINVSTRLNNDLYWLNRDQEWKPRLLVQLNRNISLTSPITIASTVDFLAIDPQRKVGLADQVNVSPIQRRVTIYDASDYAN
eukprot:6205370-Pleurochrysis_carterae.AAC.2